MGRQSDTVYPKIKAGKRIAETSITQDVQDGLDVKRNKNKMGYDGL